MWLCDWLSIHLPLESLFWMSVLIIQWFDWHIMWMVEHSPSSGKFIFKLTDDWCYLKGLIINSLKHSCLTPSAGTYPSSYTFLYAIVTVIEHLLCSTNQRAELIKGAFCTMLRYVKNKERRIAWIVKICVWLCLCIYGYMDRCMDAYMENAYTSGDGKDQMGDVRAFPISSGQVQLQPMFVLQGDREFSRFGSTVLVNVAISFNLKHKMEYDVYDIY